jgi:hypothetical protein
MLTRYRSVLIIALCIASWLGAASVTRDIPLQEVQTAFNRPMPPHPRLFMTDRQLAEIQSRMKTDVYLNGFFQAVLAKADDVLEKPSLKRIKTGRRLLSISRQCLDRIIHLSAAYRFTRRPAYLKCAEKEMVNVAAFSDWNPSHFLDVAEMTTALAIGYDWLYHDLSQESRDRIRQAIFEKGIQPSRPRQKKQPGWVHGDNNWNQVCNGGLTLGGLAIMEDEPELARYLVHRAVNGVQAVMAHYEPDGAYPEGPGYWVYGTSYNVVLLAALKSVLGTDFGLSNMPGFANSAAYYQHVTGPTGTYFNYPDSGSSGGFQPTVFWFAQKYKQPSLAWHQHQLWIKALKDGPSALVGSRLSPLLLCWYQSNAVVPQDLSWRGGGPSDVAMFRSTWTDPEAVYLAIKGGSPGVNHGHMDVGSFVVDAQGLRWARDLGPESYNKIESLGMNLWGRSQGAERWSIFRYNNLSHNTLVVNNQHQVVDGDAPIIRYSEDPAFPHVVFDMSAVYQGQLAQALRGASLLPTGQVLIQDEFTATDQPTTVRWAMVTPAEISIKNATHALLTQKGKTMRFIVHTSANTQLKTYSTKPKTKYDAANPGTRMIGFEVSLSPKQSLQTAVILDPQDVSQPTDIKLKPVLQWSND